MEQAKKILLRLARDDDALVRTDSFDSLASFPDPGVAELLNDAAMHDPDSLARSYAIRSYADVTRSQTCNRTFFSALLEHETSSRCRLSCYYALSLFGDPSAIDHVLSYLSHEDYHVRCTAISILQELINTDNMIRIRQALLERNKIETSSAVKDQIAGFLA